MTQRNEDSSPAHPGCGKGNRILREADERFLPYVFKPEYFKGSPKTPCAFSFHIKIQVFGILPYTLLERRSFETYAILLLPI